MYDDALAGTYVLCRDPSGTPCVVARLADSAFRLASVVARNEAGARLGRFLDDAVFDRRTLIQGCVPDVSAGASARWLPPPHDRLSVWVEVRGREASRLEEQAIFPPPPRSPPGGGPS